MENKKRMDYLVGKIRELNNAYYNLNETIVSDFEYDLMFRELVKLEEDYPEYKYEDSPTSKVGAEIIGDLEKVKHTEKMLSLGNSMSTAELSSFFDKTEKSLNENDAEVIGELKIDGLAVSLKYNKGKFVQGATRGDGVIGEDITAQLKKLNDVPLTVDYLEPFEVRGEVYMKKSVLKELNEIREAEGKTVFANCRNAASGSLKLKDVEEVGKRKLSLFIYSLHGMKTIDTQENALKFVKKSGFSINENFKVGTGKKFLSDVVEEFGKMREKLDYDIDGIVFKINKVSSQEELGFNSREPKWATAFKFAPEEVVTKLIRIELSMGRTGTLTPNAVLEEVALSGSNVKAASLHNLDYIIEKDIREGDYVVVRKAGEIIPEVVKVVIEKRAEGLNSFEYPKVCPYCENDLVKNEGEVAIKCVNDNCIEKKKFKLIYFASKVCMDIAGLGEGVLSILIANELVSSIEDIYTLKDKKEALLNIERFGVRSVEKLLSSIEKSKENDPSKLLCGLGISLVGRRASEEIISELKSISELVKAKESDLIKIDICGEKMSANIVDFFRDEANKELISNLENMGLNMVRETDDNEINEDELNDKFVDKTFMVTGKFVESGLKRGDVESMIKSSGGKIGSSVNKNTDVLVVGEAAGSKLTKAEKLGIEIWTESDFLSKVNR